MDKKSTLLTILLSLSLVSPSYAVIRGAKKRFKPKEYKRSQGAGATNDGGVVDTSAGQVTTSGNTCQDTDALPLQFLDYISAIDPIIEIEHNINTTEPKKKLNITMPLFLKKCINIKVGARLLPDNNVGLQIHNTFDLAGAIKGKKVTIDGQEVEYTSAKINEMSQVEKLEACLRVNNLIDEENELVTPEEVSQYQQYSSPDIEIDGFDPTYPSKIVYETPRKEFLAGIGPLFQADDRVAGSKCFAYEDISPNGFFLNSKEQAREQKLVAACNSNTISAIESALKSIGNGHHLKDDLEKALVRARKDAATTMIGELEELYQEIKDSDEEDFDQALERYAAKMEEYNTLIIEPTKESINTLYKATSRTSPKSEERKRAIASLEEATDLMNMLNDKKTKIGLQPVLKTLNANGYNDEANAVARAQIEAKHFGQVKKGSRKSRNNRNRSYTPRSAFNNAQKEANKYARYTEQKRREYESKNGYAIHSGYEKEIANNFYFRAQNATQRFRAFQNDFWKACEKPQWSFKQHTDEDMCYEYADRYESMEARSRKMYEDNMNRYDFQMGRYKQFVSWEEAARRVDDRYDPYYNDDPFRRYNDGLGDLDYDSSLFYSGRSPGSTDRSLRLPTSDFQFDCNPMRGNMGPHCASTQFFNGRPLPQPTVDAVPYRRH